MKGFFTFTMVKYTMENFSMDSNMDLEFNLIPVKLLSWKDNFVMDIKLGNFILKNLLKNILDFSKTDFIMGKVVSPLMTTFIKEFLKEDKRMGMERNIILKLESN